MLFRCCSCGVHDTMLAYQQETPFLANKQSTATRGSHRASMNAGTPGGFPENYGTTTTPPIHAKSMTAILVVRPVRYGRVVVVLLLLHTLALRREGRTAFPATTTAVDRSLSSFIYSLLDARCSLRFLSLVVVCFTGGREPVRARPTVCAGSRRGPVRPAGRRVVVVVAVAVASHRRRRRRRPPTP